MRIKKKPKASKLRKLIYPPIRLDGKVYADHGRVYNLYVSCFTQSDSPTRPQWGILVGQDLEDKMCRVFLIPDSKRKEILGCLSPDDWQEIESMTEKLSEAMDIVAKKLEVQA